MERGTGGEQRRAQGLDGIFLQGDFNADPWGHAVQNLIQGHGFESAYALPRPHAQAQDLATFGGLSAASARDDMQRGVVPATTVKTRAGGGFKSGYKKRMIDYILQLPEVHVGPAEKSQAQPQ